jgi:ADP-heptose:LPS heptosyltransferase
MKILVIRFSSIGDIVLTTPVVRCLKNQLDCEVHYATKKEYASVLYGNPYIDKFHFLEKDLDGLVKQLKDEKFDHVIDLHNNLRTSHIKLRLGGKWSRLSKRNNPQRLLVQFKTKQMPDVQNLQRYIQTAEKLGITYDGKGLDFFIKPEDELDVLRLLPVEFRENYVCLVPGAKFATKSIPVDKCLEIIQHITRPIVILGGPAETEAGEEITRLSNRNDVLNLCGKISLGKSAAAIKHAYSIITADTGLMHMAASFDKKIVSVWGNTVPEFGMYPLLPEDGNGQSIISEVKDLPCRPCSKIGYAKCPKGHFKCMKDQESAFISQYSE